MTRKKTKTKPAPVNYKKAMGFDSMFANEKTNFTVGVTVLMLAVYIIICFCSYFNTADADQSLVMHPLAGDLINTGREFHNYCGSYGAYISHFLIYCCFGLAAFMIPLFLLACAMSLMGIYRLNLWKWFFCMMLVMIWCSITFAKFLAPLLTDLVFNAGGGHGAFICQSLENMIGPPGLTAILGLTAIFFLTYLSYDTIIIIRKMLNPIGYLTNKVKFSFANAGEDNTVLQPEQSANLKPEDNLVSTPTVSSNITTADNESTATTEVRKETLVDTPQQPSQSEEGIGLEIEQGTVEESAGGGVMADNQILSPYDPKATLSRYQYPTLGLLR